MKRKGCPTWAIKKEKNGACISKIERLHNIGNAVRIVKYPGHKKYPIGVEFAPIFKNNTIDKDNWGQVELGPGSHSSIFKSYNNAKKFVKGMKSWKPKNKYDDGLEFSQNLIKKINKF